MTDIGGILERAKAATVDYYRLTGEPLGVTGEYGEYLTAKLLGLELVDTKSPGFDALDEKDRKIQIKARSIPSKKDARAEPHTGRHLDNQQSDCRLTLPPSWGRARKTALSGKAEPLNAVSFPKPWKFRTRPNQGQDVACCRPQSRRLRHLITGR